MSRSSSAGASRAEKKNCRYFSDIITLTHKTLKKINADIGKPLEMTLMNREFELGDQKRGIYECGEDQQHPVNALETFMRDLRDLRLRRDLAELDDEEVALTQAQSEDIPPSPPPKSKKTPLQQLADAKQLKKVALFLLHCYVRIFMMQAKKDLAEPHTINTVRMIADSDMLRRAWQSEMDAEMKVFAAERGFKVRAKVLDESKSTLSKLFTPAELEKLSARWKEILGGDISFTHDHDRTNAQGSSAAAAKSRIAQAIDNYNTSSDTSSSESETSKDESASQLESESDSEDEKQPMSKRARTNVPSTAEVSSNKKTTELEEDSDLEGFYFTEEKNKSSQPLLQKLQARRAQPKADLKTGGSTADDDRRLPSRKKISAPEYEEEWEESIFPTQSQQRKRANASSAATTTTKTKTTIKASTKTNKRKHKKDSDADSESGSENFVSPLTSSAAAASRVLRTAAASSSSSSSSKSKDAVTLTLTKEQWATIKRSMHDIIEVLSAIEKS